MFGQKRIPSREGGVEIVVEELCTRMVAQGHNVTCYNRGGHHVSGSEYDSKRLKEEKGSAYLYSVHIHIYFSIYNADSRNIYLYSVFACIRVYVFLG